MATMTDESGTFDVDGLSDLEINEILEIRADNRREVAEAIDKAVAAALEEMGLACEGYAKLACPVDTGRLRSSITHMTKPSDDAVYVGTNVEYGPCVELGTVHMEARPFLKPAAADHADVYREILRRRLGG